MSCENVSCTIDNAILKQLQKEVEELSKTSTLNFLILNKRFDECVVYIKDNLSGYLIDMFISMKANGELDTIIKETLVNGVNSFVEHEVKSCETNSDALTVFDFISLEVKRNENIGVSYLVTKIKNGLKPFVNFTNGTNTNPYSSAKNVIDYMKTVNKPFAINAGLHGVTVKDGISLIEANTATNEGYYILAINGDGELKAFPRTATGTQIINAGYRDAINIWSPIIENNVFFNENILDSNHEDYDYIFNQRHPRQILGTLEDGTYIIITCDGRMVDEAGLTFAEMKQIVSDEGCVTAYNLDGGASTQTVIGKHLVSRKLSDSRTVGTVITFEGEVLNYAKFLC